MKYSIIILFLFGILSCANKGEKTKQNLPVKIYPISFYEQISNPSITAEDGDTDTTSYDSSLRVHYIVYNLPQTDTAYLAKELNLFTYPVLRYYSNLKEFQIDFYKPGDGLDSNYFEIEDDELDPYYKNQLASVSIYHNKDTLDYNWMFYDNGEIMIPDSSDVELKDYVPNSKDNGDK